MQEESFRLQWRNFGDNLEAAFSEARQEPAFTDVTLACEDGSVSAHRLVLAAASPTLHTLLRSLPHHYPLIFLRGVARAELEHLVEFMYTGEVAVPALLLAPLLAAARDLQVKGLVGHDGCRQEFRSKHVRIRRVSKAEEVREGEQVAKGEVQAVYETQKLNANLSEEEETSWEEPNGIHKDWVNNNEDGDQEMWKQLDEDERLMYMELNQLLMSKMERTVEGRWRCLACGRVSRDRVTSMKHCETHLGLAHTCSKCGVVYRTRASIARHYTLVHGERRRSFSCARSHR